MEEGEDDGIGGNGGDDGRGLELRGFLFALVLLAAVVRAGWCRFLLFPPSAAGSGGESIFSFFSFFSFSLP
jgi:hypothetical protein